MSASPSPRGPARAAVLLPPWRNALRQHRLAAVTALGHLGRQPLATVLALLVVAAALLPPALLFAAARGLDQAVAAEARAAGIITLFLASGSTPQALLQQVQGLPQVESASHISAAQALEALAARSGVDNLRALLPANPLPETLLLQPRADLDAAAVLALRTRLQALPGIEAMRTNEDRLAHWAALEPLLEGLWWLFGGLFGLTVVAIEFTLVRRLVLEQGALLEVARWMGATAAWLNRPALYAGLGIGLGGGLLALLMLLGLWLWVIPELQPWLSAVGLPGVWQGLHGWQLLVWLPLASGLLGLFGAFVATLDTRTD